MPKNPVRRRTHIRGHKIRVEVQGAAGIENQLTQAEVDEADVVVIASDVPIEQNDRFARANAILSRAPAVMRTVVESGGRGIANGKGFYRYTRDEAEQWERLFLKFNYEIRRLALRYPSRLRTPAVASGGKTAQSRSSKRPSRKR